MIDRKGIETILRDLAIADFSWINPKKIIVAHWVRIKCTFGCPDYGMGTCPPHTPSVEDCGKFFREYRTGLIIRLTTFADKNNYPSEWSAKMTAKLLEAERRIFLMGYQKTFLLNQTCCGLCSECSGNRINCKDKKNARPSPEAFAVDVYKTARKAGMEIAVIADNPSDIHRYAFVMIE